MSKRRAQELADEAEIENQHAVVTRAEAMDRDRTDEIESVLDSDRETLLERLELDSPPGPITEDGEAWDEAIDALRESGAKAVSTAMRTRVETLRERAERPYPSLLRLGFQPEKPFEFVSGQYTRISYEEEAPRVYSIASSPNAEDMELCIRRVPGGHLTPDLCDRTKEGDELFVRGPYGDEFMLQDPTDRDLVFVATGTGAAPFKSMIDYTFEEDLDEFEGVERDVWLFLGSSWADDLPYREAFADLAERHGNFHPVMTCSREKQLSDWDGETEYVQHTLLKYLDPEATNTESLPPEIEAFVGSDPANEVDARIDPANAEVYVCGIGAMCESVRDVIEPLGVSDLYYEEESFG